MKNKHFTIEEQVKSCKDNCKKNGKRFDEFYDICPHCGIALPITNYSEDSEKLMKDQGIEISGSICGYCHKELDNEI